MAKARQGIVLKEGKGAQVLMDDGFFRPFGHGKTVPDGVMRFPSLRQADKAAAELQIAAHERGERVSCRAVEIR